MNRDDLLFCLESSPGEHVQFAQGLKGLSIPLGALKALGPAVLKEAIDGFIFKVLGFVVVILKSFKIVNGIRAKLLGRGKMVLWMKFF